MCGRFTLRASPAQLTEVFSLLREPEVTARYNIAPTQDVVAVRSTEDGREPANLHWGLVPFWAKDPSIGGRLINARAETVSTKPAFREAFRERRCLVLADGFYEWKRLTPRDKRPIHFHLGEPDSATIRPFAFAGLWAKWGPRENRLESCTIVTTTANDVLRPVHDRMPVILSTEDIDAWLNPDSPEDDLLALLRPFPDSQMRATPVSTTVNNYRNEGPDCLAPFGDGRQQRTLFG